MQFLHAGIKIGSNSLVKRIYQKEFFIWELKFEFSECSTFLNKSLKNSGLEKQLL